MKNKFDDYPTDDELDNDDKYSVCPECGGHDDEHELECSNNVDGFARLIQDGYD